MGDEKKVEQLAGELKLLKNEVKQGLVSVHDYLLNMKVPTAPPAGAGLSIAEESTVSVKGGLEMLNKNFPPLAKPPPPPKPEPVEEKRQPEPEPEPEAPPDNPEPREPQRPVYPPVPAVTSQEPQVNTLANLIGWVSLVKQKLGVQHLPTILEVYGMCGALTPRTKRIILRLAELETGTAVNECGPDVWSQLVLQLHGIITGNSLGTPVPGESETAADTDERQAKERPLKLKLVLPGSNGSDNELSLGEFRPEPPHRKPAR